MAVYKIPQDIEAEDKLIGPLTFKKAIFAGIMAVALFISWKLAAIPPRPFWGLIPAFTVALPTGLLAFYPSKDQPVEVLLAAKIRFFLKPRKRLWDQSGMKELVTITVPKRVEKHLTKDLNQDQVQSRLHALAATIDTRGWAVKNMNVNMYTAPNYGAAAATVDSSSDRLIAGTSLPVAVPDFSVTAEDDVLDNRNNPVAQHFDEMMRQSDAQHKNQVRQQMQQALQPQPTPQAQAPQFNIPSQQSYPTSTPSNVPNDFYFMNQPSGAVDAGLATFSAPQTVTPNSNPAPTVQPVAQQTPAISVEEEQSLLAQIHAEKERERLQQNGNGHLRTILTPAQQQEIEQQSAAAERARLQAEAAIEAERQAEHHRLAAQHTVSVSVMPADQPTQQKASAPTPNPAILDLAKNDDLDVATIARQATKETEKKSDSNSGEVVISLH